MNKYIAIAVSALFLMGCEAAVGDKCTTSNDCPQGTVCDTDSPGGYCLASNCESDEECPEEAVCVFFTNAISYCMLKCKNAKDCRSGYSCRSDIPDTHSFCYIAPDYVYGREEANKLDYEPPSGE